MRRARSTNGWGIVMVAALAAGATVRVAARAVAQAMARGCRFIMFLGRDRVYTPLA